jgi:predicted permease
LLLPLGCVVSARLFAIHCWRRAGHAEEASHTNHLLLLLAAALDALFLPGGSLSIVGDVVNMLGRPLTSPTCRCCCCTQDALFLPGGSLSIVGYVVDMLGQPLIPVLLVVLGANLAAGPGPGHLPLHSVLTVVATRLVLLPLLGCGAVLGTQQSGLIDMQDPLALVVMMVAWSTPTVAQSACCGMVVPLSLYNPNTRVKKAPFVVAAA